MQTCSCSFVLSLPAMLLCPSSPPPPPSSPDKHLGARATGVLNSLFNAPALRSGENSPLSAYPGKTPATPAWFAAPAALASGERAEGCLCFAACGMCPRTGPPLPDREHPHELACTCWPRRGCSPSLVLRVQNEGGSARWVHRSLPDSESRERTVSMIRLRTSPPEPPLPRLPGSVLPEWAPRPTVSSLRRTLCERLACAHVPGAGSHHPGSRPRAVSRRKRHPGQRHNELP